MLKMRLELTYISALSRIVCLHSELARTKSTLAPILRHATDWAPLERVNGCGLEQMLIRCGVLVPERVKVSTRL